MAFKLIVLAAMVACAHAGAIGYSAPVYEDAAYAYGAPSHGAIHAVAAGPVSVAHGGAVAVHTQVSDESYDPHPQYSYSYDVHDTITGDVKSQHEERDGDQVRGRYSLVEPDGSKRVVEYAADAHSGFQAHVHREPATHAVAPVAIAAAGHHQVAAAPIAIAAAGHHHVAAAPIAIAAGHHHVAAAPIAIAAGHHHVAAAPYAIAAGHHQVAAAPYAIDAHHGHAAYY